MSGFATNFVSAKYGAAGLAAASALALAGAYIAQYGFDLLPCHLCLWQRVPYAIAIMAGLAAWFFNPRPWLWLMALLFIGGSAIAFFHAGVEYRWWEGTNACSYDLASLSTEELREAIMKPKPRCDAVAWSFLGISMAGYNVAYSALLAFVAQHFARKA